MTTTAAPATPLTVTGWRDYDPEASALPGMCLGSHDITAPAAEAARALYDAGARRITLPHPVDLTDERAAADTVRALALIGALTSLAVAVDWRLTPGPGPDSWRALSHLHPPAALVDAPEEALELWRAQYYICKCVYRQGPGFIQVRDRRWGDLRRFTIDEPDYQEAITVLTEGAPVDAVPSSVLDVFLQEDLALRIGPHAWWAPYRVRRWPQASMAI